MARSFRGMQVAFGIVGTVAAVVAMFAYAVSDDIYFGNSSELPRQSSAQLSTVPGQDNFEETRTVRLQTSSELDAGLSSDDQPASSHIDLEPSAQEQRQQDEATGASTDDIQIADETVAESANFNVPALVDNEPSVHVVEENTGSQDTQSVDRPEPNAPTIENIAITHQSYDRDDKKASAGADDGHKGKKDRHNDDKSGKSDHHKPDKGHKGKGHHKAD